MAFLLRQVPHVGNQYRARGYCNEAGVVVGLDIINAAAAHELLSVEHLVRGVGLGETVAGQQADSHHG